ncbi:MAG: hypothetical protein FWB77_00635 [Treponema sp.]|nr:hypothetical protein [Treponema sp.]
MKKFTIILFILMFALPFGVFAVEEPFGDDPLDVGAKRPFLVEDRRFEVGILNMNFNFTNDFLSVSDIFQDTIKLNLDDLNDGFNLNFGIGITPFYFNFKTKKGWGFGLSTDVESMGVFGLPGTMLTLSEANKEVADIAGAAFAAVTAKATFNVQKFKIKVNPSLFYALAYIKPPSLTYTMSNTDEGTKLFIDYDLQLYTGIAAQGDMYAVTSKPGLDFTVGVEYPLAKEIGLTKILPILDFDVSLDFINVPIVSSKMYDRMRMNGRIGRDAVLDFTELEDFFSGTENEPIFSSDTEVGVRRPFKMILTVEWRPLFGSKLLTVMPMLGFCVNELYNDVGSIEAGLSARLNLANCFIATLGLCYTDRMFVNSLDLALNLRAFEFNIGADLRSQDFAKSWSGAGFGLKIGFKFGW